MYRVVLAKKKKKKYEFTIHRHDIIKYTLISSQYIDTVWRNISHNNEEVKTSEIIV